MTKKSGLLLVAHDGGGASILACIARTALGSVTVVADGPAVSVFREFGVHTTTELPRELPSMVLVGTSASSALEIEAVRHFDERGVRTVAFLDHWENYPGRFTRSGVTTWPQAVAVGDGYALEEARRSLPARLEIVYWPNPYHLYVLARMSSRELPEEDRSPGEIRVLYLCEPADELPHSVGGLHLGYRVTDVVATIDAHARSVVERYEGTHVSVKVRLHPRQRSDPGTTLAEDLMGRGWRTTTGPLENDLAWCDVAVGTRTNALFIARTVGRAVGVISPPGGAPHSLPGSGWTDAIEAIEHAVRSMREARLS